MVGTADVISSGGGSGDLSWPTTTTARSITGDSTTLVAADFNTSNTYI